MAGLFNRLKRWTSVEVIKTVDLNAEFDNIINNLGPAGMSGWSASIAQMKIQTSPGTFGSESLATSLNGEIERIRYQLNAIIGGPDGVWYDAPDLTLTQINSLLNNPPQNQIVSGRTRSGSLQPMHLVANGSSVGITLKATSVNFVVKINDVDVVFSTDITAGGFTQPPSSQNTATISDSDLNTDNGYNCGDYMASYKCIGNNPDTSSIYYLSPPLLEEFPITVTSMGTNISNLIGTYQAFSYQHGSGTKEYFVGYVASSTQITHCFRGYFFDNSDNPIVSQSMQDGDTITLMALTWVYVNSSGVISVSYTNPRYSSVAPTSPNVGDYWYDLINQEWKDYNGSSWVVSNAILVGVCIQDGTNTVGARSFDTYRAYSDASNITVSNYSTTEFRTPNIENTINVYGSSFVFDKDVIRWNISNLDSGVTISASTTYFCYLSETGVPYISNRAPHRRWNLGGYYHPSQPWRCVAMVWGTGSNTFDPNLVSNLMKSGQAITDKSLSISTRKNQPYVVTTTSAPAVGGRDYYSFSNTTDIFTVSGTAGASVVNVTDGSGYPISVGQYSSGRGLGIYFTGQLEITPSGTANIFLFRAINGSSSYTEATGFTWGSASTGTYTTSGTTSGTSGTGVGTFGTSGTISTSSQFPMTGMYFKDYGCSPGINTYIMKAQTGSSATTLTLNFVGFTVEEV